VGADSKSIRAAQRAGTPRFGVDGLEDDLSLAESLQFRGRSLPYVRALTILRAILGAGPDGVAWAVSALERVWAERDFHAYFARPFLLLAALRAEALASWDHPLARAFATQDPDPFAVTRASVLAALSPRRVGLWVSLATRTPQTNEVSRAVVWRWPVALAGASNRARPLALIDIGASGGLNLIGDQLTEAWTDGGGVPLPVATNVDAPVRVGFDIAPLNFMLDEDVAWGRACIWAGAVERAARFERAVAEWRKREPPPPVHKLNSSLVPARLPELLSKFPAAGLIVVYQTVTAEYMDPMKRDQYESGMRRWLARCSPRRAVWVEAECSPDRPSAAMQITAHVPDGAGAVRTINLGWTSVHPSVVHVNATGAGELKAHFAALP
jgi:hypothetical protein